MPVLMGAGLLYVGLWLAGGQGRDLAVAGLEALPFLGLAMLAYAGERGRGARVLSAGYLISLTAGVALIAIGQSLQALDPDIDLAHLGELAAAERRQVQIIAAGILAGLALGWACYLPAVRRAVSRVLPIDPRSFVHATALVTVVSCTLMLFVPLTVLGAPPLLSTIESGDTSDGSLLTDLYGLFWIVPAAVLAVGYPFRRTFRQTLARLGLVRPRWRVVLAGAGLGVLMVIAITPVNVLIDWLFRALDLPRTSTEGTEELFSYASNPLGAVVVGVTAGLGEELSVRGILQPRLGLLLSNLFFVSLHAFQYSWDALLTVFIVGMTLGFVRRRWNTTTSAFAHGTYDCILLLLSSFTGTHFLRT